MSTGTPGAEGGSGSSEESPRAGARHKPRCPRRSPVAARQPQPGHPRAPDLQSGTGGQAEEEEAAGAPQASQTVTCAGAGGRGLSCRGARADTEVTASSVHGPARPALEARRWKLLETTRSLRWRQMEGNAAEHRECFPGGMTQAAEQRPARGRPRAAREPPAVPSDHAPGRRFRWLAQAVAGTAKPGYSQLSNRAHAGAPLTGSTGNRHRRQPTNVFFRN